MQRKECERIVAGSDQQSKQDSNVHATYLETKKNKKPKKSFYQLWSVKFSKATKNIRLFLVRRIFKKDAVGSLWFYIFIRIIILFCFQST